MEKTFALIGFEEFPNLTEFFSRTERLTGRAKANFLIVNALCPDLFPQTNPPPWVALFPSHGAEWGEKAIQAFAAGAKMVCSWQDALGSRIFQEIENNMSWALCQYPTNRQNPNQC